MAQKKGERRDRVLGDDGGREKRRDRVLARWGKGGNGSARGEAAREPQRSRSLSTDTHIPTVGMNADFAMLGKDPAEIP